LFCGRKSRGMAATGARAGMATDISCSRHIGG
jgi:hypothetical protein